MDFKEVILSRRSVNFFDPEKDVPENLIREMTEMAANSPSSYNLQPWQLIILRDAEEKKKLQQLAFNQPKVSEAPVVFIVLADREGWKAGHPFAEKNFKEKCKEGSAAPDNYEIYIASCQKLYGEDVQKQQAFACKNAGFFAMSLMLAAKSLGVDTHPMDGFDHEGVRKAFRIPDNYWIPLLLAAGYFKSGQTLSPPKWRKTFEEISVRFD